MQAANRITSFNGCDQYPFVLDWYEPDLPRRTVTARRRQTIQIPSWMAAPPHIQTGAHDQPFDFCGHVSMLCQAITARCPDVSHVNVSRILFSVTQARNSRASGLQARVTPMRFRGGALTRRMHGTEYQVQRFRVNGREMLYVMTFCLPRFLDQDFDQKLITLFHELYHIGTEFDGDLRRHCGRYNVHTHSQKEYDREMAYLAREYLSQGADESLHGFLRLNFAQLQHRHGAVVGFVVPRPKLLPISRRSATDVEIEPQSFAESQF
jgi:predicted metallopeptidase